MNHRFRIQFRHSAGNLHISLAGEFNGMCAWELIKTIKRQQAGTGRVFVDTAGLCKIAAEGADLFKAHMDGKHLQPGRLYFKGNNGFKLAPNGSRVIICRNKQHQQERKNEKSTHYLRYDNR